MPDIIKPHPDFDDFISALNKNKVTYVIVGAYALAYHGHPRATGDIDFWVHPIKKNAVLLLDALEDFGFGSLDISAEDILSGKIIQLGVPPVRIDLITKLDGLSIDEILDSRIQDQLGEHSVWYLGRDAYVKNKKSAGRHKDLADLELLGESLE